MNKNIINIVIAVIVAGGASFYGGMHYAQSKKTSPVNFTNMTQEERQAMRRQTGGIGGVRGMRAGTGDGITVGEIISKDDASITIKLRDGGSRIVFLSEKTPVTKSAPGTTADLDVGTQVSAMGTSNSDGSITAESVQIRPAMPADAQKTATTPQAQ